ncbi:hypothetical protein LWI29_030838 [Acer saccharum]|uniref:Uncharacterized protein n=1 Tax=Acer saccharum TaxID=4024 RepID=A0AA39T6Q1_ACESA|nr:hypothetical protein LWI29_030838 [Acer saccharum]
MYKNNPGKRRMILKGYSKWEWDVIVHHASCVLDDANSNPSRSLEAEANNTANYRWSFISSVPIYSARFHWNAEQ